MLFKEVLANTVLPAMLRHLVFQPANLDCMLSMMNWKSAADCFFMENGESQVFSKGYCVPDGQMIGEVMKGILGGVGRKQDS